MSAVDDVLRDPENHMPSCQTHSVAGRPRRNVAVRMIETATFERTYDLAEFAALAGVEPTEEAVRQLLDDDESRCDTYCIQGRPGVLDGTLDAAPTITDREWTVTLTEKEEQAMTDTTETEPLPSWVGDRPLRLCTAADTRETHLALIPVLEAHGWTIREVPSGGKKAIPPGWTDDDQAALEAAQQRVGVGSRFD